jgi:SAM-dependent methyltransferase
MAAGVAALGVDLNFAMLRLAQELLLEGRATYDLRRIGLVYDPVEIVVPDDAATDRVDFWAADCIALPLRAASFGLAGAINLVDCIAAPTNMLHEAARVLAPGAPAFFTTPYDWAENATERANWLGGHSDRGPLKGAGEPVLTATLQQAGFEVLSEDDDVPWQLRIHARSVMHYALHLVVCRRGRTETGQSIFS